MCLLALFYRMVEDAPLVLGANREEYYARDGLPPRVLEGPVRAVAGVDPVAGGTWLGVNQFGVIVAVTNRPLSQLPERPRSRGLLTRDLLTQPDAASAARYAVRELETKHYAGCNFLIADAQSATVIEAGDWLRVRPLPPGLHLLSNADVNDPTDARLTYSVEVLERTAYRDGDDCATALRHLLGLREPERPAVCLRFGDRGTVSSSVLVVRQSLHESRYWHAQGPPDQTPYADYSDLLKQLIEGVNRRP